MMHLKYNMVGTGVVITTRYFSVLFVTLTQLETKWLLQQNKKVLIQTVIS